MVRSWIELLLIAALVVAAPTIAWAESADDRAQAEAHHERGLELYRANDFAGAAREFEAAQALAPAASNLFNLARCYERTGDLVRAIDALERYLAEELPADRRERGEAELARLRALLEPSIPRQQSTAVSIAVVSEPSGAELYVDGRPQGAEVATPATLHLAPGEHMIEARLAGHQPESQEITVEAGRTQVVQFQLTPQAEEGGEETSAPSRVAWTGAIQIDAGAGFTLMDDPIGTTALVGLGLAAGLRFGTPHQSRGFEARPVRLELIVGFDASLGAETLLEASGGGRLSIALGHLPIRVEGELSLALSVALVEVGGEREAELGLGLIPGISAVFQVLSWLEIALRPLRLELLGLAGEFPGGFDVRWSVDAQVRFRM